ncbi:hypothetical protein HDE_12778 [Halotydeus destructor]|nr:hypothetical protein HDE_12778 [Halotydeus destructor]
MKQNVIYMKYYRIAVTFTLFVFFVIILNESTRYERHFVPKPRHVYRNYDFQLQHYINKWKSVGQTCPPPVVDANGPAVKGYLQNVSYTCPKVEPLTQVDLKGHITLTDYAIRHNVSCFASYFKTWPKYDNYVIYEKRVELTAKGIKLTKDKNLANVTCHQDGGQVYRNTHHFIPAIKRKHVKDSPSVIFFILESLSKLSFERFMPRTREALESLGHVHKFDNVVKPMDNSFPNTIAILTGQRVPWNESGILSEVDLKPDFFDKKLPYVWDNFKDGGYVTGFLEDMGLIGIFNYGKKGFIEPPTDWYPKPFWVQMYPEVGDFKIYDVMQNKSRYCFEQNGAKVDILVNQTLQFMAKHDEISQPYFLMSFHSQVTHENFNNFQLVDESIANFIIRSKKLLDNAILVFAGDHGPRYRGMTFTGMGRLESRMPFVSLRVPRRLDKKHPHLRRYLKANQESLLTWYDFNQLLKDVATGSFTEQPVISKLSHINPSRTLIPRNRTCSDAGIDEVYCVCDGKIDMVVDGSYDLVGANKAVLAFLDKLLAKLTKSRMVSFQVSRKPIKARYILPKPGERFKYDEIEITLELVPLNITVQETARRLAGNESNPWTVQHENDKLHNLMIKFVKK